MQSRVQVLDLLHQRLDLLLVCALNLARLSNRHVQGKPDIASFTSAQPADSTGDILRGNADPVLSAVGSAKCKAALGSASLRNDAVVVVECLLDGDKDANIGLVVIVFGLIVPDLGVVMAWYRQSRMLLLVCWPDSMERPGKADMPYQQPGCPWAIPRRST